MNQKLYRPSRKGLFINWLIFLLFTLELCSLWDNPLPQHLKELLTEDKALHLSLVLKAFAALFFIHLASSHIAFLFSSVELNRDKLDLYKFFTKTEVPLSNISHCEMKFHWLIFLFTLSLSHSYRVTLYLKSGEKVFFTAYLEDAKDLVKKISPQ